MSKKGSEPGVQPVRPLDPAWRVKFKSTKELANDKKKPPRNNSKDVLKKKETL
jgi:hypothetical protein